MWIARTLLFISAAGWGLGAIVYLVAALIGGTPMDEWVAVIGALLFITLAGAYGLWRGAVWGPVLIVASTALLAGVTFTVAKAVVDHPAGAFGAATLLGILVLSIGVAIAELSARRRVG